MINLPNKSLAKNRFIHIGLILSTLLIICGATLYFQQRAEATGVSGWDAGRIIDDSIFTNTQTMDVASIQSFLNSKMPVCDTLHDGFYGASGTWYGPPFTCLKDYSENSKTSAQIIYEASQDYRINPQVLIVLLQKEQALVTDTWPASFQYKTATGYGCPDTSACDTQYYGFTNQVRNAAKMFRAILDDSPTWYTPYELGNNYIQYNPSASCGGSNVYIQNRATQALYNYTPYQPNTATLAAGWGSADCGAYGNRNFYLYFTQWFGAATSAATYSYSVVSKEYYSDYTYVNKFPDNFSVEPGQTFWVKIKVKNTGNQAWYNNNLHLGATSPQDRNSDFMSNDWLGPNRPASISESSVGSGETATFMFSMKAPSALGNYAESYGLLIEGYRWLPDSFVVPITVTSSKPVYSVQTQSFDVYSDANMTNKIDASRVVKYTNSKIYVKAIIKNTGNQILPGSSTKLATSGPEDRVSVYGDESWASGGNRVVGAKEGDLLPQATGTFTFSMTTPSIAQAQTNEQFGLVIDGMLWVTDNIGAVSVQTIKRPPSSLQPGQIVTVGEPILSDNEKYELILQGDGNLVLYYGRKPLWASWTVGKGGIWLVMQTDGNLVLYDKNWVAVWNSRTPGKGESSLVMQIDGNLVIYNARGYTWASWTVQ